MKQRVRPPEEVSGGEIGELLPSGVETRRGGLPPECGVVWMAGPGVSLGGSLGSEDQGFSWRSSDSDLDQGVFPPGLLFPLWVFKMKGRNLIGGDKLRPS